MSILTRHQRRRFVYISLSIVLSLILVFPIGLFVRSLFVENEEDADLPRNCDKNIIRTHFMDDKSPQELFEQKPFRSDFIYELDNANVCDSLKLHALIFVVSKSTNVESRNAIRRTWGDFNHIKSIEKYSYLQLKLLFLIDIDESHLLSIKLEQSIHHDIIQVRLPENYILSSYRDMAILHWTSTYCPETLTTVKTDDDIFLNIFLLANIINTIVSSNVTNRLTSTCDASDTSAMIYGVSLKDAKVVRHASDPILEGSRYIVTRSEYPCRYYPYYMSGFGYIVNRPARSKLLCTFLRDKQPFHLSDVYVTGILPEYVGIERLNLGVFISYRSNDDCGEYFKEHNPSRYACASTIHYNNQKRNIFDQYNRYWQQIYENRRIYLERIFKLSEKNK
ncbi:hypothetical protein I4U23_018379 [Adineta vaga]|nr:hypothetical protein I4U23_018379 [Adineta vaga]